jgi:plasmid stability protein
MGRNITLHVDNELIRKAKVLAAQHGTSVSGLLTRHLEQLISEEEAYVTARQHALTLLERGFHLGGKIPCPREQWHDR